MKITFIHKAASSPYVYRLAMTAMLCLIPGGMAQAQVSIVSAIDMALRTSPRIKSSEAELEKARALLAESKDVYIPSLNAGAGLGQAYGYSPYPPTLFTLDSTALVYSSSQFSYIRSARAGFEAATHALADIKESVAEDTALAFLALDHDQHREEVLRQQATYSARLLQIVQDRFDAGQDSRMDLTNAKLADARLRLAVLHTQGDIAVDREHLGHLLGIPPTSLHAEGGFPTSPVTTQATASSGSYGNESVAAAFASARARQLQAKGDTHFLYRPQISFFGKYNRYATFTNSFKTLQTTYNGLTADDEAFGVQVTIPILDRYRRSKGLESVADANKALHDAEFAQLSVLDAQSKLSHNVELLQAQAEVASLDQDLAQQQLEIVQLQLQSASSSAPPMTPKDEQNALITEREKYLALVDNTFQLHQAEISLLRQSGKLQDWILHAGLSAAPAGPSPQPPH